MKTQRILAAILGLVLLLALAPAGWAADGETIPEFLQKKNTVKINLTPGEDKKFNDDIVKAGVQADLYLIAAAKPVKGYDTYEYEKLAGSLSAFQTALDDALATDPNDNFDEIKDQAARKETMLKKFTPLAYKIAEVVLDKNYSAIQPQSFKASGSTIEAAGLDAGLYLLVLRGSNLTEKQLTIKIDGEDEEFGYVTRTKEKSSDKDEAGKSGTEHIATRAFSDKYEYIFEPQLITVPTRTDTDGLQYNTAFGEWSNVLNVNIKATQDDRKGKIKVKKTVSDYLDLSKDETFEPAMFTFEVIATETNDRTSKVLYRKQVSINIDGTDTVGKTEVLKDLPAGSYAWVTEIYQGAHYQVNAATNTGPIEVKADKIEVVNGKTTVTEQPDATATFDNKNNDIHRGGHGIENIFTYNGSNWTDEWTTEPGTAKNGGAV
jgi:hypothetical protein